MYRIFNKRKKNDMANKTKCFMHRIHKKKKKRKCQIIQNVSCKL